MSHRTHIKICGITRLEDALLAVELGADALGFILYPKSPRCILPAEARAIIDRLPPFITPVAVVVNETAAAVNALLAETGCRAAQVHGVDAPDYPLQVQAPVILVISVASPVDLAMPEYCRHARAVLLDTKAPGQYGGTGKTFDWTIAHEAKALGKPIILAGGLTPENVGAAIRIADPYAVDLNSGIEQAPGMKDPEKIRAAFTAIYAAKC